MIVDKIIYDIDGVVIKTFVEGSKRWHSASNGRFCKPPSEVEMKDHREFVRRKADETAVVKLLSGESPRCGSSGGRDTPMLMDQPSSVGALSPLPQSGTPFLELMGTSIPPQRPVHHEIHSDTASGRSTTLIVQRTSQTIENPLNLDLLKIKDSLEERNRFLESDYERLKTKFDSSETLWKQEVMAKEQEMNRSRNLANEFGNQAIDRMNQLYAEAMDEINQSYAEIGLKDKQLAFLAEEIKNSKENAKENIEFLQAIVKSAHGRLGDQEQIIQDQTASGSKAMRTIGNLQADITKLEAKITEQDSGAIGRSRCSAIA